MLQLIRDRAQGVLAWIIVGIIIVPFALFGINEYFGPDPDVNVAKVNDIEIPFNDFQLVYQQVRAFRQSVMGENFNPAFMNEAGMKRDALDRLIRSEVLAQGAMEAGFRIGDAHLSQQIKEQEQFHSDGKFDQETYTRLLSSIGLSPNKYESTLRRDLLAGQILTSITDTAMVTDYEIEAMLRIKEQQRKIGYLVLKMTDYMDDSEISDEEVQQYFDSHLDQFAIPEQISLEYIELSADQLATNIQVDEEALFKMYEDQASDFMVGEERQARHILIKLEDNADDEAIEAARVKAKELIQRIQADESFADLAKEHSDDAGSAVDGGDLGFFGKGVMVKPFEEKVFSMAVGDVSEPVKSPFGFHIIKLEEIKAGENKSFEELRDQLEQEYKDHKAEDQFFDMADLLADISYENPDSLSVPAEELNLTILTTDLFGRDFGQGIASDQKVRDTAFSLDVLEAGNNSEPIEIGSNRLAVFRVKERNLASTQPLEEVREQVNNQLSRDKAKELTEKAGQELLARYQEGEDIETLAKEYNATWQKTDFIGRLGSTDDPNVIREAFKMKKPTVESPVTGSLSLVTGDYALITLYEVRVGEPSIVEEATKEALKSTLARKTSQQESDGLVKNLKQRAKIVEYPEQLL